MHFEIDISDRQASFPVNRHAIRAAVLVALQAEQVASAILSISIVDNSTMRALNREHLQHDYPTDVISFQLGFESDCDDEGTERLRAAGATLEGEIVVSAEMATDMAAEGRWSTQDELMLYVIHGLLHICGYDDLTKFEQTIMRSRERTILKSLGCDAIYAEDLSAGDSGDSEGV